MSVTAYKWLARGTVRLQRFTSDSRSIHGLGDSARQNICIERFTIYRNQRLQRGHYQRDCGRSSQYYIGEGDFGLRHHHDTHFDIYDSNFVLIILTETLRYIEKR